MTQISVGQNPIRIHAKISISRGGKHTVPIKEHVSSTDLPLESRCFGNFCSMVFLVPHDYFCNSTSFGPKIIPKGQFKVPKKVKEFCSFATFDKKTPPFLP